MFQIDFNSWYLTHALKLINKIGHKKSALAFNLRRLKPNIGSSRV